MIKLEVIIVVPENPNGQSFLLLFCLVILRLLRFDGFVASRYFGYLNMMNFKGSRTLVSRKPCFSGARKPVLLGTRKPWLSVFWGFVAIYKFHKSFSAPVSIFEVYFGLSW